MCHIRVTIVAILLGFCTMAEIAGAAEAEAWAALRAGRHVALMRHTYGGRQVDDLGQRASRACPLSTRLGLRIVRRAGSEAPKASDTRR